MDVLAKPEFSGGISYRCMQIDDEKWKCGHCNRGIITLRDDKKCKVCGSKINILYGKR